MWFGGQNMRRVRQQGHWIWSPNTRSRPWAPSTLAAAEYEREKLSSFEKKYSRFLKKHFQLRLFQDATFFQPVVEYLRAFLLVLSQGWITLTAKSAGTHVWVMYACSYAYILMRNREAKQGSARGGVFFVSKLGEQPVSSDHWSSLLPFVSSGMACRWHIGAFFTNGCHIKNTLWECLRMRTESSWMNGSIS